MAARITEIKSPADALKRAAGIAVYVYFQTTGVCRSICELLKSRTKNLETSGTGATAILSPPVKTTAGDFLSKPLWAVQDARLDAALSATLKHFKPRRIARPEPNPPPPDSGVKSGIRIQLSWNIQIACNYNCPYCWFHGKWKEYSGKSVNLDAKEWGIHWTRFNNLYGPAHIEIAGGEPFAYPGFMDILQELTRHNTVMVITNFAWDPSTIQGRLNPAKVNFACSFHPSFAPPADAFADKIARLRALGFCANASIVAYPPYLEHLADWTDAFLARGIYLMVQPFRGRWKGRYYPTAYTPATRRALDWFMNGEFLKYYPREIVSAALSKPSTGDKVIDAGQLARDYQLNLKTTKGIPCNSGKLYGRLQYNGDMCRCSQGGYVGNFLDAGFKMNTDAQPCQYLTCECINEAVYLQGCPLGPAP